MIRSKLIIALCIMLLTATGFTIAEWYKYETTYAQLDFPEKPNTTVQTVATTIGELPMEISMYEGVPDKDDNHLYGFISSVYPDSLINSDKKELLPKFFRSSIDGAVNNVKGKLLTEKEIQMEGYPGRDVRIDYGDGIAILHIRVFLVKNRVMIIQTITPTSKENNPAAERFHKSFKIKK